MIAQRAGVSTTAVSLALRNQNRVSPAVTTKIKAIARELGYRPPAFLQEAMGRLRTDNPTRFHSELALCLDFDPTLKEKANHLRWYGVEERANALGYTVEIFYLLKWTAKSLRSVLRARNIRGVLLVHQNWLPSDREFLMEEFACVLLGHAGRIGLPVHFVEADDFQAGKRTMQEVLARGYQRIGFARFHPLDTEGLCRSGIYSAIPDYMSISAFEMTSIIGDRQRFLEWVKAERPDCIVTVVVQVRQWLEQEGFRIPEDIGLANPKSSSFLEDWSGVNTLWEEMSAVGVNKVVSMLRQGASGIPPVQECILIEGKWSEGTTLRPSRNQLLYGAQPPALESVEESSSLKCLQLQPHVNRSLTRAGGWFGGGVLLHCPPGEHEICGSRFRILDEGSNENAVLIMASKHCPGRETPNPAQVDIPIGRRVKAIHFLHACAWSIGSIRNFAGYHFIDSQGRSRTLPLVARQSLSGPESDGNIQDWWPLQSPLTSKHVRPIHLTAFGDPELYSAYLYLLEWVNPHPRKFVQTLRISSNPEAETTLGVLAITLVV